MIYAKSILIALLASLSFALSAQEEPPVEQGFISDELFIYAHAGAGTNFRILGSINAGAEVKITGVEENGYSQVIDSRNRKVWVESKYISKTAGLRSVIAELNQKLANAESDAGEASNELIQTNEKVALLTTKNAALTSELSALNESLLKVQSQLDSQDMDTKKEWFFNGAIVLGIGLVLGLLLPRLVSRKRSAMDNWK